MREDGLLHLNRRDIFAAADDDVLFPVDDVHVIFVVPDRHVAGVQPAIDDRAAGRFRLLVIAVHHVIAANNNLADTLHIARHISPLRIHHANFVADDRPARRRFVARAIFLAAIVHCVFIAGGGRDRAGLSQSVARHHVATKCLLHARN